MSTSRTLDNKNHQFFCIISRNTIEGVHTADSLQTTRLINWHIRVIDGSFVIVGGNIAARGHRQYNSVGQLLCTHNYYHDASSSRADFFVAILHCFRSWADLARSLYPIPVQSLLFVIHSILGLCLYLLFPPVDLPIACCLKMERANACT